MSFLRLPLITTLIWQFLKSTSRMRCSSTELVPSGHAHTLINGQGLSHFDAHLSDLAVAADMLQGNLTELLVDQGTSVRMLS